MKEIVDIYNSRGSKVLHKRDVYHNPYGFDQFEDNPSYSLSSNFVDLNSNPLDVDNDSNDCDNEHVPGCLNNVAPYNELINLDIKSEAHKQALSQLRKSQYGYMLFNNYENFRWNHKRVITKYNNSNKRKERKKKRTQREIQKHMDKTISTLLTASRYIQSQHIHWKENGYISSLLLQNHVLATNVKFYTKSSFFKFAFNQITTLNICTTLSLNIFYQIPKVHIQPLLFSCSTEDGNNMQKIYFELISMKAAAISFSNHGLIFLIPPVNDVLVQWGLHRYDLFASGTSYKTVYEKLAQSNIPLLGGFIPLLERDLLSLQTHFIKNNNEIINNTDFVQYLSKILGSVHPNMSRNNIEKILDIINEESQTEEMPILKKTKFPHELNTPLKSQIDISSPKQLASSLHSITERESKKYNEENTFSIDRVSKKPPSSPHISPHSQHSSNLPHLNQVQKPQSQHLHSYQSPSTPHSLKSSNYPPKNSFSRSHPPNSRNISNRSSSSPNDRKGTTHLTRYLWVSYKKNPSINFDIIQHDFGRFGKIEKIRTNPSHFAFINFEHKKDAINAVNFWKKQSKYDIIRFNENNTPRPKKQRSSSHHHHHRPYQHQHHHHPHQHHRQFS